MTVLRTLLSPAETHYFIPFIFIPARTLADHINAIHNDGASHLAVSCGDTLFHIVYVTLLRRVVMNRKSILENKFSQWISDS